MIKKTLYFGNPKYLSVSLQQLKINDPNDATTTSIPIEDIGIIVFDHPQITYTQSVICQLIENNAVLIWCGYNHLPISYTLPLAHNDIYSEKVKFQINASEPLKKQLWKQTVSQKLKNQIAVLDYFGYSTHKIERMIPKISSGDVENFEGQAAVIYWNQLFEDYNTRRGRKEAYPNAFFNYGYAILRAVIARSLVGSGCLPVLGIHHTNKYNSYCLADDIMEPYRPIVDKMVLEYLITENPQHENLSTKDKAFLLQIPVIDILIDGKSSPLMLAAQRTTASLDKCYQGILNKIKYPTL